MYQREETIDLGIIASDIAQWSINHYGYFVKSSNDKVEMIRSFAEDLSRLPQDAIRFVNKAQNDWVDEGNTRPPTIPEFIKALRINYNREVELNTVKLEHKPSTTNYAGMWDHAEAKGLDSALNYMKTIYNPREVSQATKCIIRSFFKKNGYDIKKIEQLMNR